MAGELPSVIKRRFIDFVGAGILRVSCVEAGILRDLCRNPEGCGHYEAMRDACF